MCACENDEGGACVPNARAFRDLKLESSPENECVAPYALLWLMLLALALLEANGGEQHYKPGEVRKARDDRNSDNTLQAVTLVCANRLHMKPTLIWKSLSRHKGRNLCGRFADSGLWCRGHIAARTVTTARDQRHHDVPLWDLHLKCPR